MRILLVEDDPILALIAEMALQDDGHEIVGPAYDSDQALRLAQDHDIDLALVDINLNGHDEGIQLARALYERFSLHSLYVSGQVEVAKAHSRYAVGLLSKPYSPGDLSRSARIIHALIRGDQALSVPVPDPLQIFTDSSVFLRNPA